MVIEMEGVTLTLGRGYVGVITHEQRSCAKCGRMTYFFENRHGETKCVGCAGKMLVGSVS